VSPIVATSLNAPQYARLVSLVIGVPTWALLVYIILSEIFSKLSNVTDVNFSDMLSSVGPNLWAKNKLL
jgi:hypothetical protein